LEVVFRFARSYPKTDKNCIFPIQKQSLSPKFAIQTDSFQQTCLFSTDKQGGSLMTLQLFGFGLALIENMRKYCKSYSQIFRLRPTELLSQAE
jgi:hypothetical protein